METSLHFVFPNSALAKASFFKRRKKDGEKEKSVIKVAEPFGGFFYLIMNCFIDIYFLIC
jgi:hypothetical protein